MVKNIEGVGKVVNNIEVLPTSPMDDQIRRAVYRAVYRGTGVVAIRLSAVPSIHIIVKNGDVTLEGVVDSEGDKNLANIRANGVPNVFAVKNNLVVAPAKVRSRNKQIGKNLRLAIYKLAGLFFWVRAYLSVARRFRANAGL